MRIKDFIETLKDLDENIEIVIATPDGYASPKVKKDIVNFKHDYSGVTYMDDAITLL